MKTIHLKFQANITYGGATFDTDLNIEYQHTGKEYHYKKGKREFFTHSESIAEKNKTKGIKVKETPGYYFINRLSIPTVNAEGKIDTWYINNEGDTYKVNSVCEEGKRMHEILSRQQDEITDYKQLADEFIKN